MIKVAICDDEKNALYAICGAVEKMFQKENLVVNVTAFSDLSTLEKDVLRESFDLIMLDVDMKDKINGIRFAERLRNMDVTAEIIFASGLESAVFDSFQAKPLAFVRKSCFIKDFSKCLPLIQEKLYAKQHGEEYVTVTKGARVENVKVSDVMYVEGNLKKQIYYLIGGGEYVTKKSMRETESFLKDKGFLRIHCGFIVNCKYISEISGSDVILIDGKTLPVARSRVTESRKLYLQWLKKNKINNL